MTTATFTAAPTNATDAQFRDWGSKFSAALAAIGFVKTADTGQINWATVVRPPTTFTKQGYEIWRFNDSLQATAPLFIKFEYGSNSNSDTYIGIWFQIGKGSNGSGTLTGAIGAQLTSNLWSVSNTTGTWYMSSGDGSMLNWSLCPSVMNLANGSFISIERSRTAAGAPSGDAVSVIGQSGNTSSAALYYNACNYGQTNYSNDSYVWPLPTQGIQDLSMSLNGSTAPLVQCIFWDKLAKIWTARSCLRGMRLDMPSLVPITVPGLGVYLPLGDGGRNYGSNFFTHAIAWF